MTLTVADKRVLHLAVDLHRDHGYGVFPRGPSQHRQFKKLVSRGLLRFETMGVDMNRENGDAPDVQIHRITERGRVALMPSGVSIREQARSRAAARHQRRRGVMLEQT